MPRICSLLYQSMVWGIERTSIVRLKYARGGASLVVQWVGITSQCRGLKFEPWSRKIPHAVWKLSPSATMKDPTCCN